MTCPFCKSENTTHCVYSFPDIYPGKSFWCEECHKFFDPPQLNFPKKEERSN